MKRCAARRLTPLLLFLSLFGCGGAGDQAPEAGPVAYYSTYFFRESQLLALMVFSGGRFYGFYQSNFRDPQFPTYYYQGFFVASSVPGGGSVDLYRGHDFNFDQRQSTPVTATLQYPAEDQVFGAVTSQTGPEDVFAGRYSSSAEPTKVADLPGAYAGQFRSLRTSSTLKATLNGSGALSAQTPEGCLLTGRLSARPTGNLYDAEVNLSGSCGGVVGPYRGPALQSQLTRNVYLMLTTEQLDDGVFLHLFDER